MKWVVSGLIGDKSITMQYKKNVMQNNSFLSTGGYIESNLIINHAQ